MHTAFMKDRDDLPVALHVRLPSNLVKYLQREARQSKVSVDVYLTRVLSDIYRQRMLSLLAQAERASQEE